MARTLIPTIVANYQSYTNLTAASSVQVVDMTNGMYFVNPKNQKIVFYVLNFDADTSTEVTVTSVIDQAGRGNSTCDDVYQETVAAGAITMFGPFNATWWNQPNGTVLVNFNATADDIFVIAVQIA